mgnify:CR=1 FL=1
MAVEAVRGCGFRKVGGMYLCGEYIAVPCDRLPYPLSTCPCCGAGLKFSRAYTEINPLALFGIHHDCQDKIPSCFLCDPRPDIAFLMSVGAGSYPSPEDFMREARVQGISKRIQHKPKNLVPGKTVVYLGHPKACRISVPAESAAVQYGLDLIDGGQARLLDSDQQKNQFGIFSAFIPQRIEKLVWESELTDQLRADLEKQGITPVPITDGDKDHA